MDDGGPVWIGIDVGGARATTALVAVDANLQVVIVEILTGDAAVLQVADIAREIAATRHVMEIAYDPRRFQGESLRLESEGIGPMVAFPQSHARMTQASESLHSAIVEGRLTHPGDPGLDQQVANAVAKATGRGWRIEQADPSRNVDAVVALAMAVERAQVKAAPVKLLAWI